MRNALFAVTLLSLAATATSAMMGCSKSSGSGEASSTGGNTSTGSSQGLGGSGGSPRGGSGGSSSPGLGGSSSPGLGGSSHSGGSAGGDTGTPAKGGSGGSGGSADSSGGITGGNDAGGTAANRGDGASRGGSGDFGGNTGTGGTIGSGGWIGTGGTSGSGGTMGNGGTAGSSGAGPTGPCDIYQAAGTPCAAAHSTVRALYGAFSGALYQVSRASDNTSKEIPTLTAGGFADSSVQDSFCSGTTCTIPIIYDQSPNGNHLRVTWFANWLPKGGKPAAATAAKITVGGHTVYGIKVTSGSDIAYRTGAPLSGTASVANGSSTITFSSPQTLAKGTPLMFVAELSSCTTYNCPYYSEAAATTASTTATLTAKYNGPSNAATTAWNEGTQGVATGDDPEAIYAVLDGTTYNAGCCFDYGNAEINGVDDGAATMEALYWGADTQFGESGGGSGPWVGADIENGLSFGYANGSPKVSTNTPVNFPYVTAMLKGLSASQCPSGLTSSGCFELKAGNAQSGALAVKFDATTGGYGARPPGYTPMKKTGGIILGTGGDGLSSGAGTWFEGAMTIGAPSDSADNEVQANVVAAGYGH